eukprot:m.10660 g.10660  ORF g.10660 m.10660 type:complete len:533 (+) comp3827_c0_seq1:85-1683(+)
MDPRTLVHNVVVEDEPGNLTSLIGFPVERYVVTELEEIVDEAVVAVAMDSDGVGAAGASGCLTMLDKHHIMSRSGLSSRFALQHLRQLGFQNSISDLVPQAVPNHVSYGTGRRTKALLDLVSTNLKLMPALVPFADLQKIPHQHCLSPEEITAAPHLHGIVLAVHDVISRVKQALRYPAAGHMLFYKSAMVHALKACTPTTPAAAGDNDDDDDDDGQDLGNRLKHAALAAATRLRLNISDDQLVAHALDVRFKNVDPAEQDRLVATLRHAFARFAQPEASNSRGERGQATLASGSSLVDSAVAGQQSRGDAGAGGAGGGAGVCGVGGSGGVGDGSLSDQERTMTGEQEAQCVSGLLAGVAAGASRAAASPSHGVANELDRAPSDATAATLPQGLLLDYCLTNWFEWSDDLPSLFPVFQGGSQPTSEELAALPVGELYNRLATEAHLKFGNLPRMARQYLVGQLPTEARDCIEAAGLQFAHRIGSDEDESVAAERRALLQANREFLARYRISRLNMSMDTAASHIVSSLARHT